MLIREESGFGGYSSELEFVGPNPDRNAKISYYMQKRHIFGKTKIEIFDKDNKLVTELPAGKSKGVNTISWNGHLKRPKVAKAKTFAFGGFTTPRAPAGTYKVVFTKGKETYQTSIELKNDPDSPYTDKQRRQLHKITMELYNMSEELAYLVYEIDSLIAAAGDKNKSTVDKLNVLKETLVITTGDNYVGSAEPQLREDLLDLYSKVAGAFAPPSRPEMANLKLIKERFKEAKNTFKNINKKGIPVELKSLEEFLNES